MTERTENKVERLTMRKEVTMENGIVVLKLIMPDKGAVESLMRDVKENEYSGFAVEGDVRCPCCEEGIGPVTVDLVPNTRLSAESLILPGGATLFTLSGELERCRLASGS